MTAPELEQRAINVIRGLAMDAPHARPLRVTRARRWRSPRSPTCCGRGSCATTPADPEWPDRDRFVLSAGHASILLYSMLHLTGYDLTPRRPRGVPAVGHRSTPGHPERGHTDGVEVTTGPLGQGIGNAVGMAIAERQLRARFGADVVDHRTFCIVGDGDLSEGLSHEAASLAGHLGLGRLVCVYDDNHISIDGPTELALSDDAAARFRAYGWHVEDLGEAAEDLDALEAALRAGRRRGGPPVAASSCAATSPTPRRPRPTTPTAHGYALKDDEIREAKEVMGLPPTRPSTCPTTCSSSTGPPASRGARATARPGPKRLDAYDGDRAALDACLAGHRRCPAGTDALPTWEPGEKVATRMASGSVPAGPRRRGARARRRRRRPHRRTPAPC